MTMRILALNIGNSSLVGGVFSGKRLHRRIRVDLDCVTTERGFSRKVAPLLSGPIDRVVLCSVVPRLTRPFMRRLSRATGLSPILLTAKSPHGLRIAYRDPSKLGTDRLAAALGARERFPGRNLMVVDCGTACTVTALRSDGTLLGGAIFPGLQLWAKALASGTAQLPRVKPAKPRSALGRSPEEAIASGLYHGHVGAIRNLLNAIGGKAFGTKVPLVIGTGGMAPIFAKEKLFTRTEPNLILFGLRRFAVDFEHA